MAGRRTMVEWINDALNDTELGKLTAISCVHRVVQSQQEVHTTKITGPVDAAVLATMFMSKAQYAVNDTPGNQAFFLLAFYDGNGEPKGRFSFRIDGGADLGHGETEPPTREGVLMQQMRMTEAGFQFFFRQMSEVVKQQTDYTRFQGITMRELMQENRDALALAKEVILAKALDEDARLLRKVQLERETLERAQLMKLGPALINSMTGREIFPQSTADTALVESIIGSLTEDHIKKLAEVLPPEIMGPIAARASEHLDKQRAAALAAEQAILNKKLPTKGTGDDGDKSGTSVADTDATDSPDFH